MLSMPPPDPSHPVLTSPRADLLDVLTTPSIYHRRLSLHFSPKAVFPRDREVFIRVGAAQIRLLRAFILNNDPLMAIDEVVKTKQLTLAILLWVYFRRLPYRIIIEQVPFHVWTFHILRSCYHTVYTWAYIVSNNYKMA